jgi:hypothetical protein
MLRHRLAVPHSFTVAWENGLLMRCAGVILLWSSAVLAQVPNGIGVAPSRTVNLTPDQAEFSAYVTAAADASQDQVLEVFRNAGVTNAAVVDGSQTSSYIVSFTTPPEAMRQMAQKLDQIRLNRPRAFVDFSYSATLSASESAVQTVRASLLPRLIADARAEAQILAAAASLKLGPIQSVNDIDNQPRSVGSVIGGSLIAVGNPISFQLSLLLGSVAVRPVPSASGTQFSFPVAVRFNLQ